MYIALILLISISPGDSGYYDIAYLKDRLKYILTINYQPFAGTTHNLWDRVWAKGYSSLQFNRLKVIKTFLLGS